MVIAQFFHPLSYDTGKPHTSSFTVTACDKRWLRICYWQQSLMLTSPTATTAKGTCALEQSNCNGGTGLCDNISSIAGGSVLSADQHLEHTPCIQSHVITLSDRSQSSSYQWIQRCVLVQNISGVLISQGCIPLNDIWGHPDGISCLYWIPAQSQHTKCTHVCVQCPCTVLLVPKCLQCRLVGHMY